MDESESNGHQNKPDENIEKPPAAIERPHSAVNNAAGGNQSNNKKTNWPQRIETVCAVLLVIITGCYTFYARKQLKAMQGQIAEMKNARGQAKTDNAKAITAQQAIAQSSLAASQSDFKKSLTETQESFRGDQRAWVGPMDGALPSYNDGRKQVYIKFGEKPKFAITITNSGKTPALKMSSIIAVWAYRSTDEFIPYYGQSESASSIQTLFPGARVILNTRSDLPEVTSSQINSLSGGEYTYYVYGRINYKDVFKRPHKTTFCVYVSKDFTQLLNCTTYNNAD